MGLFDFFKRKQSTAKFTPSNASKEDIFKAIFAEMAKQPPSKGFASGTVFDLVRQCHDFFEKAVNENDIKALHDFFVKGYLGYLDNPTALGSIPNTLNKENNDTNPAQWNVSTNKLSNGDSVCLCFMPVQNDIHTARIFGIILGVHGDGYYYCMLNKSENQPSEVVRNKAMAGVETIGSVSGLGFELMNSFIECISKNYYS